MSNWPGSLLGVLFLLAVSHVWGQDVMHRRFSSYEGLPSATVYRVVADSTGQMWMGTENGLVHYNGRGFTHYPFTDSIYRNGVLGLCSDRQGGLWVGLYQQGIYHFKDGRLRLINGSEQIVKRIIRLYTTTSGELWGNTNSGELFKMQGDSIRRVLVPYVVNHFNLYRDTVWASTDNGLFFRPAKGASFALWPGTDSIRTEQFEIGPDDRRWLLTDSQLLQMKGYELEEVVIPEQEQPPRRICADGNGGLWLHFYKKGLRRWVPGEELPPPLDFVPNSTIVNRMQLDQYGQMWVATEGAGVYVCFNLGKMTLFPAKDLKTLTVDSTGILWGGGFGKLVRVKGRELEKVPLPDLISDELITLIGDGPDGWTIGSAVKAWIQKEEGWDIVKLFNGMLGLAPYRGSENWMFSHYAGISEFTFEKNTMPDVGEAPFPYSRVDKLAMGPDSSLWLGATGRLYRINNGDTTSWGREEGIPDAQIFDLEFCGDSLWVATSGGLLNLKSGLLRRYTERDGMPHPTCRSLCRDYTGRLWLATEGGLAYLKGDKFFPCQWGGKSLTDIPGALAADKEGKLWVAYPEALACIDLTTPALEHPIHEAMLELYDSEGHRVKAGHQFQYENNPFNLKGFVRERGWDHAGSYIYQYRLVGEDGSWQKSSDGSFSFSTLLPGEYTLEVRLKDRFQGATSEVQSLPFTVLPAFYQTFWFAALLVLGGVGILLIFFRIYLIKVHRKAALKLENERQLHRLKHLALTHSLHPHYLTNALQSLQMFLQTHSADSGATYLKVFARLIRLNLEDAQQPFLTLEKEIVRLRLYLQLEKWRLEERLAYHIKVDDEVDLEDHLIPGMVLQPIIENALWHGLLPKPEGGEIIITIKEIEEGRLAISVEDNGVGWTPPTEAKDRTSLGMGLIKEKLDWSTLPYELVVEVLEDEAGKLAGTRVVLYITTKEPELVSNRLL